MMLADNFIIDFIKLNTWKEINSRRGARKWTPIREEISYNFETLLYVHFERWKFLSLLYIERVTGLISAGIHKFPRSVFIIGFQDDLFRHVSYRWKFYRNFLRNCFFIIVTKKIKNFLWIFLFYWKWHFFKSFRRQRSRWKRYPSKETFRTMRTFRIFYSSNKW